MKTLSQMYPKVRPQKRPKNLAEAAFYDMAEADGLIITKKGWPDYACFTPDGNLILVEIKPLRSSRLKAWQWAIMEKLTSLGIDCYRWSPDTGFTKIVAPIQHL